ncbi:MAG TPA: DNA (cytosine-5-)-methyltransferase [Caulobacterales bacterium]|nr:DNA (cytosine-5-)-methyltransferase [Caulobacterales bacterium]
MPNPKAQKKTLAEALARPPRANGRLRRFYDSEVRGLALRVTPAGEAAFTLDGRVIGKPPAMSLADARRIALAAGADAVSPIRYLEVCAGIGSASLAFESLGWRCAGMAEIDPKARAFLAQRFPATKLHGDFRKITPAKAGRVDVLVGGPPCQPWSRIGKRNPDEDPRTELAVEFIDLARTVGAPWFVFENVPGLVETQEGRETWRRCLRHADECGFHVAWRVLDTRQFGLPARRRRLFAVGHSGRPEAAYCTLFEPRHAAWPHPAEAIATEHRKARGREISQARAIAINIHNNQKLGDFLPTLRRSAPGYAAVLIDECELRCFTMTELERCMGFPDGWTDFEWKEAPASYRMRAALLGNAFCPAILHWIAKSIDRTGIRTGSGQLGLGTL